MKTRIRVSHLVAGLLVVTLLAAGKCSTNTTYQALATVQATVDTGMKAYADLVVAGKISVADQDKVRKAFGDYQQSAGTATFAIEAAKAAQAASKQPDNTAVQTAIAKATDAATSLMVLLRQLGVKGV